MFTSCFVYFHFVHFIHQGWIVTRAFFQIHSEKIAFSINKNQCTQLLGIYRHTKERNISVSFKLLE